MKKKYVRAMLIVFPLLVLIGCSIAAYSIIYGHQPHLSKGAKSESSHDGKASAATDISSKSQGSQDEAGSTSTRTQDGGKTSGTVSSAMSASTATSAAAVSSTGGNAAAGATTGTTATNTATVKTTATDNATTGATTHGTNPIKVKGLYLTGWTVGIDSRLNHFIELAKKTEINTYVVDIKDDDGLVGYKSDVPKVKELNTWYEKYDVGKVLKAFHDNGIHVVGRIVCFKDPAASGKMPDLAVRNKDGGVWKERNSEGQLISWLNPYKRETWDYLVQIAREAVNKGFDEIQFDYVRFPSDGRKDDIDLGSIQEKKYEAIDGFLAYARKELPGVVLSADVFGIICESPADTENIGQYLEMIGKDMEYISPMVYPSHYAFGQSVNGITFPRPDLDPYNVVYNSLIKAGKRISAVKGYNAKIRPYLQDFTATWLRDGNYQTYGEAQVRQQIKAAYDAGLDEWIIWNADNTYSESAFNMELD